VRFFSSVDVSNPGAGALKSAGVTRIARDSARSMTTAVISTLMRRRGGSIAARPVFGTPEAIDGRRSAVSSIASVAAGTVLEDVAGLSSTSRFGAGSDRRGPKQHRRWAGGPNERTRGDVDDAVDEVVADGRAEVDEDGDNVRGGRSRLRLTGAHSRSASKRCRGGTSS